MSGPNAHRDEPEVLLRVEGVSKSFGGVEALRGAELTVRAGELHFLLGENGAVRRAHLSEGWFVNRGKPAVFADHSLSASA